MGTETVAAQLSDDSKLWDDFDEFQTDYQNKSEAVRPNWRPLRPNSRLLPRCLSWRLQRASWCSVMSFLRWSD